PSAAIYHITNKGEPPHRPSVPEVLSTSGGWCAFRLGSTKSIQAFRRPRTLKLRKRLRTRRQSQPRLLRGREDMDIRRQPVGFIERTHPHEPNAGPRLRIIAPD